MSPRVLRRAGGLVAAWCFAPIAVRAALLLHARIVPSLADVHGVLADLLVAIVFAAACAPLFARSRLAVWLLVPWTLLNYMSFEFTKTMNAVPPWQSIRFLGDRTFVGGSVLTISNPVLFVVMIGGMLLFARELARGQPLAPVRRLLLPLGSALVVAGVVAFAWPLDRSLLAWRQTNVVAANVTNLVQPAAVRAPLDIESEAKLARLFRVDLSGTPIVPAAAGKKPNILLVLLESVCGTDLPSIAARQMSPSPGMMPRLDAIARENLYFQSFITHQRGTNRGLYTSLCGNYPKLSTATAVMTELAHGPDLECLPAVLRRNGYRTVYLQAAPLAFMMKDAFMPKAGFTEVLGSEQFTTSNARSIWGVDDRTFFQRARAQVRELRAKPGPWMMSLLTVGTHHPYAVPDDFVSREPAGSYARAARYADEAVSDFIRGLKEDGALEDTIVLVSSDEARGIDEGGDDFAKVSTQNLSFMIALLPSRKSEILTETFAQSDTAVSVLDITGLDPTSGPFIGRSLFRRYETPRRIFVANQYTRTVGMLDSQLRDLWSCDERLGACDRFELDQNSLVAPTRRRSAAAPEDVSFIAAAQTRAAGATVSPYRDVELTNDVAVNIVDPEYQLLFAGQYVYLPPDAAVDVDIELVTSGDGEASLTSDLVTDGSTRELAKPETLALQPGQAVTLRYTFRGDAGIHGVEARAIAKRSGANGLAVRFKRATMRIRVAGWADRRGMTLRERTIAPAAVD